MPVPQRINMNIRKYCIKVYYNTHEFMKLKELAKKVNLGLSPFIRQQTFLEDHIILKDLKSTSDSIERITKKDIERKMVVNPIAKNFKECMQEIKQGYKLQPIGSFDTEIKFIEVEE